MQRCGKFRNGLDGYVSRLGGNCDHMSEDLTAIRADVEADAAAHHLVFDDLAELIIVAVTLGPDPGTSVPDMLIGQSHRQIINKLAIVLTRSRVYPGRAHKRLLVHDFTLYTLADGRGLAR